ncbi:uncharacterized protein A4U43_UnF9090 [Asparagus officinalis]|uniref:Uncharacterized protein n=1 Tax=Asparagus officinalis TaxID=4686 RepID=A0A1R3L5T3_ASPOF|nr:uncharacterized protein A4U43_UnF9090 [Asparagus officinalis]
MMGRRRGMRRAGGARLSSLGDGWRTWDEEVDRDWVCSGLGSATVGRRSWTCEVKGGGGEAPGAGIDSAGRGAGTCIEDSMMLVLIQIHAWDEVRSDFEYERSSFNFRLLEKFVD